MIPENWTKWDIAIMVGGILFILWLCLTSAAQGAELDSFGCGVAVEDHSYYVTSPYSWLCAPSVGLSSKSAIDTLWWSNGDSWKQIEVNDFVWFNDSPKPVWVDNVTTVPEPSGFALRFFCAFCVGWTIADFVMKLTRR